VYIVGMGVHACGLVSVGQIGCQVELYGNFEEVYLCEIKESRAEVLQGAR